MQLSSAFIPGFRFLKAPALALAAALALLLLATACAGNGGGDAAAVPAGPAVLELVPNTTTRVEVVDVATAESGDNPAATAVAAELIGLEGFGNQLESYGILTPDIDSLAVAYNRNGDRVALMDGVFDFEVFRDAVSEQEWEDESYREYELWTLPGAPGAWALIESAGEEGEETLPKGYLLNGTQAGVKDVLQDQGRPERLLLNDPESVLNKVLEQAGPGWAIQGREEWCGNFNSRGCEALAFAASSSAEDEFAVNLKIVLMYASERAATSGERDVEDRLEQVEDDADDPPPFDYGVIQASGEFIVFDLTVDEDDFVRLLSLLELDW